MKSTIAEKYKVRLEALPLERQSEPLWQQPEFNAIISYTPGPRKEMILTFVDGSVFDYHDRWALNQADWAERDKSVIWQPTWR